MAAVKRLVKAVWYWAHRRSAKTCARVALRRCHPQGKRTGWQISKLQYSAPPRGARTVFDCTSPDGFERLIIKVYARRASAQKSTDIQRMVAEKTALVVNPVFFDPFCGALATPYLTGNTLTGPLKTNARPQMIAMAGALLAQFHCGVQVPETTASPDPFEANWQVRKNDSWPEFVPQLVARLDQIQTKLHPDLRARVLLFYDFHPANMILTKNGLRLVDRSREGTGFVETDIARFLFHLLVTRLRQGDSNKDALTLHQKDRASFLAAYNGEPDLPLHLDHALDREALRRWIHAKHRGKQSKPVVDALEAWVQDMRRRLLS